MRYFALCMLLLFSLVAGCSHPTVDVSKVHDSLKAGATEDEVVEKFGASHTASRKQIEKLKDFEKQNLNQKFQGKADYSKASVWGNNDAFIAVFFGPDGKYRNVTRIGGG